MDSFELNKVAGAILGALLFVVGTSIVAGMLFTPRPAGIAGYALPEPEGAITGPAAPAEPEVPLPVLLASADISRGQTAARKCVSCHTFEEGQPNRVGPNLWDTVTTPKANADGFGYSAALRERAAAGEAWGYEELYQFLLNPRQYLPGTSMAFAGIRSAQERADIIAYMRTLSPNPPELPASQ